MKATESRVFQIGSAGLCFVAVLILFLARSQFSLETYPYKFPDSFDWLVNGLRYTDIPTVPFEISHRAMFLPLTEAALFSLNEENLIPLFGTVFLALTLFGLWRLLAGAGFRELAPWATLLYGTSFTVLGQSAYLGSDVAANFFLMMFALLLYRFLTTKSHKYLYGAAIAFGVGIHSQYILAIYLPAALLSLFLTTEQDRVLLTTKRIRAMFCSSSSYIALLLLFISAAIILIPRFLEFGIIYTERVQHGSLVSLHAFEWKYYIRGMLASYSWPVLAFATLGLFTGIRTQQYRLFAIFCLLWILDIFCFFTFLYTWKDIRFLIYLAVPLYILAAIGVVALFSSRRKLLAITAAAVLIYFNSSTTTTDPWDVTISLTPAHALEHRYNQGWQLERKWSIPFLLSHYLEAETFSTEQRQSVAYSTPLTELFASLSQSLNRNTSLSNKLVYFESVGTHDYYIIANRNILYARDFVTTVTNEGRLLHLIQSEPLTLILKEEDARRLGLEPTSSDWSLHHGPFVAIQTSPETAPRSLMPKRYQNLGIASVEAREHPERLFDGILDQSENYAAAPYGSPIEVNFTKSKNLKSLRIYLWDFDERSYRFQLYLKVNETWDMVEMNLKKELNGVVEVPVGVDNVQAIRIVGSYNSDEQKNPSNTSLHIKEIELIG